MFDLLTAHSRLGLTDASKDYYVNLCLDTAKAIAEKYCDRSFDYATDTVKFYDFIGKQVHLPRYPIESVTSIGDIQDATGTTLAAITNYKVNGVGGYVELFDQLHYRELDITYSGGYKQLPSDLVLALWTIFDAIWASTPGAGATVGATTAASGAIKSINIPDVGQITYDTGSSGSASAASGVLVGGLVSDIALALLEPYRRWSA
jgi:hypothetical protein